MKNIVAASALLALFAGVASASGAQNHERPDVAQTPSAVMQSVTQVAAKSVYTPKDLAQFNLGQGALVDVTVFPSGEAVTEVGGDN